MRKERQAGKQRIGENREHERATPPESVANAPEEPAAQGAAADVVRALGTEHAARGEQHTVVDAHIAVLAVEEADLLVHRGAGQAGEGDIEYLHARTQERVLHQLFRRAGVLDDDLGGGSLGREQESQGG